MATTKPNKVGKIRIKLAELIEGAMKEAGKNVIIDPADINSQLGYWASPQGGCCSWDGYGKMQDGDFVTEIHFYSWTTMGECAKAGVKVELDPPFDYEVFAKDA